ncbi:TonB-dependent receptor [Shewanella sp.]|uniref:TonB-dependent receptor domain-containing protein n=1 Tax=Shewanella sp. TaxID=50422 RepID=UPI0025F61943|nr:TonB-dependent receptor [Shewanella sp.]
MNKLASLCLLLGVAPYSDADTLKIDEENKRDKDTEVIVVIGTKLDMQQRTLEVPRSVTVITDKHIQDTQAQELTDVIKQTPSISISNNDRPLVGEIIIRGFGNERVNLIVDGANYQQYSDGSSTSTYISPLDLDPSIVKAVEITRGADGVAQGSGAIGGQIRVVTKGAWDYADTGSGVLVRGGYADANNAKHLGLTAYHAGQDLALALHANKRTFGDVEVNLSDQDGSDRGQTAIVKNDGESQDFRIKVSLESDYGRFDSNTFYTESSVADIPYANQTDWKDQPISEQETGKRFSQTFAHSYDPNVDFINLNSRIYYQEYRQNRVQFGDIILPSKTYSFDNVGMFTDKSLGLVVENSIINDWNDMTSESVMFAKLERQIFKDEIQDNLTQETSQFYGKSQGNTFSGGVINNSHWQTWLSTEAGLRYDHYRRSSDNYSEFGVNEDGQWSLNAGITLRPMEWLRLYARYNQGFRGPNIRELYKEDHWACHRPTKNCYQESQPDLKAERSENLEAGIGFIFEDTPWADKFVFKLNWFDIQVEDFIDSAPFMYKLVDDKKVFASPEEATHRDYSSKNISKLYSEGVEAELSYQIGDFDLFANYSRVRMDVEGVADFYLGTIVLEREPYDRAPQDKINLGFSWQMFNELRLSGVSSYSMDMTRLPQWQLERDMGAEGYQLHNLYLTYQPNYVDDLDVRFGIENLTDETYSVWPDDEGTSLPGRNYKVSLNYQF